MDINNWHDLKGERKEQLLILCDKKGNPVGQATREVCHKGKGKTHLAFLAFIVDSELKVVLTRRAKKKTLWADFWDASVVSHVLSGETPLTSANRRGKEELGVDVSFELLGGFYYFAQHGESAENEYCYVLLGTTDREVIANPVEIDALKRISFSALLMDSKKHSVNYTPWLLISLSKIDALKRL